MTRSKQSKTKPSASRPSQSKTARSQSHAPWYRTLPLWMYILLAAGAAGVVARFLGAPPWIIFALAAAGLIPLAGLIGRSTEDLAIYVGPKWGGLLNATFGNAAELIIAGVALRAGLLGLVKASITGSIIGNVLLVLGTGLVLGGVRHGVQTFDQREAGHNASLLIMALFGLLLPAIFNVAVPNQQLLLEEISVMVAVILIVLYFLYIAYSFTAKEPEPLQHELQREPEELHEPLARNVALGLLAGATVATVVLSEMLVGSVEAVTETLGISEFFIGVIVVPIVGNVAEHFSGIVLAGKNKMDIALGIAAGSSTQVALLVAPILVLLGLLFWQLEVISAPLDLVFVPMEIAAVGAAAIIFNYISHDGETTWLEGTILVALYIMLAVVFFFLPMNETVAH